jgi:hypothetical protein
LIVTSVGNDTVRANEDGLDTVGVCAFAAQTGVAAMAHKRDTAMPEGLNLKNIENFSSGQTTFALNMLAQLRRAKIR